jgi:GTP-binding protein Era
MASPSPAPTYKSGFVAVCGKPNVGKSTLINTLLEQKIAAVSPRPQTTRKRQLGILTLAQAQVVFIDTPGLHKPRHKLGEAMNKEAADTLEEADLLLCLFDASQPPDEEDLLLAGRLRSLKRPVPALLVLNKSDLLDTKTLEQRRLAYQALLPQAELQVVSCKQHSGLQALLARLLALLPEHPPFYPDEVVTDLYEREIAADLIREAALNLLRDEVPHGIAIRIDQFQERNSQGAYIEATLFVERESHKGIVIGQGGGMLKQIGSLARREIEAMSGRKVYLALRVKVRPNWRNDEKTLKSFGY